MRDIPAQQQRGTLKRLDEASMGMGALADSPAFPLAFTVRDLDAIEAFHVTVFGCAGSWRAAGIGSHWIAPAAS